MAGGEREADARGATTWPCPDIDISALRDDELAQLSNDLERALNALHSLSVLAIDEQVRRAAGSARPRSVVGELAASTGSSRRSLRRRAALGAVLRHLPGAEALARSGALSPDHLVSLAACARHDPERARRDAPLLLSEADLLGADDFGAASRHWRHRPTAAPEAAPSPPTPPARTAPTPHRAFPPMGGNPGAEGPASS